MHAQMCVCTREHAHPPPAQSAFLLLLLITFQVMLFSSYSMYVKPVDMNYVHILRGN